MPGRSSGHAVTRERAGAVGTGSAVVAEVGSIMSWKRVAEGLEGEECHKEEMLG